MPGTAPLAVGAPVPTDLIDGPAAWPLPGLAGLAGAPDELTLEDDR
jgi:hypothetical protein